MKRKSQVLGSSKIVSLQSIVAEYVRILYETESASFNKTWYPIVYKLT